MAKKKTGFEPNTKGVEDFLFSTPVNNLVKKYAEEIAAEVRATAPVDSGEYRDNVRVVEDVTDRAVARVVVEVDYAMKEENRNGTLTKAMLRKAR